MVAYIRFLDDRSDKSIMTDAIAVLDGENTVYHGEDCKSLTVITGEGTFRNVLDIEVE